MSSIGAWTLDYRTLLVGLMLLYPLIVLLAPPTRASLGISNSKCHINGFDEHKNENHSENVHRALRCSHHIDWKQQKACLQKPETDDFWETL